MSWCWNQSRKSRRGVTPNPKHFTDGEHCYIQFRKEHEVICSRLYSDLPLGVVLFPPSLQTDSFPVCQVAKHWWCYLWLGCSCQRNDVFQSAAKTCFTALFRICLLCAWEAVFTIYAFHFQLLSPSCLCSSLVVCEDREEPRPRLQYLWWDKWPGEPLQTFRHGTTWPSMSANHSLLSFTSELLWKLQLVTAVFLLPVCKTEADLVNLECIFFSIWKQLFMYWI